MLLLFHKPALSITAVLSQTLIVLPLKLVVKKALNFSEMVNDLI